MNRQKKFRKTYIEITNVCNLSCDFCPKNSRPPEFMNGSVFLEILENLLGISHLLHFHVMGEPLLHPEVGWFLDRCADFGYRVNLVTNGTLLAERGDALIGKPALRQVSISLQGLEYSPMPSLDEYFETIFAFIRKSKCHPGSGSAVSLRLWNIEAGADPSFQTVVLRKIASVFSAPEVRIDALPPQTPLRLAEKVYLNPAPRFEWPAGTNPEYGESGFCLGLRDQFAILVDGTVVPCCLDHAGMMALGNVAQSSIREILSSDRARRIRDGFAAGRVEEELCRKCSYRLRFNRAKIS